MLKRIRFSVVIALLLVLHILESQDIHNQESTPVTPESDSTAEITHSKKKDESHSSEIVLQKWAQQQYRAGKYELALSICDVLLEKKS